jgi:hypothetical protein
VILAGCGPVVASPSEGTDSGGQDSGTTGTTSGDPSTTVPGTTVPGTTVPGTTIGDATSEVTTDPTLLESGSFIDPSDTSEPPYGCDQWLQDCPRGEKCMPWANDGGNSWNATRCSPLDANPKAVGEPCTVEGSGVSGIDDCELGAMCWNVDAETNMGECVAFCQGSEANPTCADECSNCTLSGDGVLILCLPVCDPLAQDCGVGQGCYATGYDFACVPDLSDDAEGGGAIGTACEFINTCDPGTVCANPEVVPGCEGNGCCAPFCDVSGPDPCDAWLPGTVCTPWYEEPPPTEGCSTGTIGVCIAA